MSATATPSSSLLNPEAPEFSPAVTRTAPFYWPRPYYFHHPVTYYCNPFPFVPHTHHFSGFTNTKPPEPAAEDLRSLRRSRLGFRLLPPRLKNLNLLRHDHDKDGDQDDEIEIRLAGKTSLMIKNIPNSYGRKDLLKILDEHCRQKNIEARRVCDETRSSYNFLYLPMDFVKRANLGYAFVNFTNSVAAVRFCRDFDNFQWAVPGNKKVCEITLAKYQGKVEFTRHFSSSRFACHTDAYLPVVLSPPSDGFVFYRLTLLGYRVGFRGGASFPPQPLRHRNC